MTRPSWLPTARSRVSHPRPGERSATSRRHGPSPGHPPMMRPAFSKSPTVVACSRSPNSLGALPAKAGVGALEDDAGLVTGEHGVPVKCAEVARRVGVVVGDEFVDRWETIPGLDRHHPRRTVGFGQNATTSPRSMSGSPCVASSQSTMAAISPASGRNITLARW